MHPAGSYKKHCIPGQVFNIFGSIVNAKLVSFFAFLSLFFTTAYAGQHTIAAPIKHFEYYEGHTGLLIRQEQMIDPDACGRSDLYILRKDHPSYKELTALLMAAHLSGQPLSFFLSGCVQGLPSIVHVYSDK